MMIESEIMDSRILVVDDVELNRKLIETTLRRAGYQNIFLAHNGLEALELTREHEPDLVILDLMMPVMDGFAYCSELRKDERFADLPILVQTVLDEVDKKVTAFKLGASDYICKPLEPLEVLARTKVHLSQKLLIKKLKKHHQQMMQELDAAKQTQHRLLPSERQIQMAERMYTMQISSFYQSSSELGGDGWGILPISDSRLGIWTYDFSGHGVAAAMNVFGMHSIMQEYRQYASDPAHYLSIINRKLYSLLERHEFATMFYGVIDIDANCLQYASAASTNPLLFSVNDTPVTLSSRGFPLGALANTIYETKFVPFLRGDTLLLYSDCLIEAQNGLGKCITEEEIKVRVEKLLCSHDKKDASSIQKHLIDVLTTHQPELADDITLSVYQRL